jgi:uncharacterized protein
MAQSGHPGDGRQPFPDPARLGILPRGSKLLVMDRVSGRSVFISNGREGLLGILATTEERLPPQLIELRGRLGEELRCQGIGITAVPCFETLNTLILKLTTRCNYACTYCYDYEQSEKVTDLDPAIGHLAIKQCLEMCGPRLQVIFHGGEPFLKFDLIKRLVLAGEEMAKRLGKRILFNGITNLSLLTEDSVQFSMEHQIHWGFSLDGLPHNNALRVLKNGDATHKIFETNLRRFPEFVRSCSAMTTITSSNHGDLLEISRYFRSCGLPGWDWSLFQSIGRGRKLPISLDVQHLIPSWNELFDAVVAGEFDGFAVTPLLKYVENFLFGPGRNMCMRKECGAARDLLSISADGQIEACDCIDPKCRFSNLGHMNNTILKEARESPTAKLIRSRNVEQGQCGACIWLAVCGGTCLARSAELNVVYDDECQIALNAFDRISSHLADSTRLIEYYYSCYGANYQG